jgi:methionyl aminopeptidase
MINIRSNREIELMRQAGHINYLTHQELKKHIKAGITTGELNDIADKFMRKLGGKPSCLNYEGYPKSICISINDEVVHGIPGNRKLKNGDIVSIDFCVEYKGYQSDATITHIVGSVSKEVEDLVKNTEKSLYIGIKEVKPGAKVSAIGKAIEDYAKKCGLGVVRELVGHGLGTSIHEDPDVPNYGKPHTGPILKENMVIAVEPMLTLGDADIYMLDDGWTICTDDESPSAHFEHTVLVTKDGYEILTGE